MSSSTKFYTPENNEGEPTQVLENTQHSNSRSASNNTIDANRQRPQDVIYHKKFLGFNAFVVYACIKPTVSLVLPTRIKQIFSSETTRHTQTPILLRSEKYWGHVSRL